MENPSKSPRPASLDTSANYQGDTVKVDPEGKKRLLELQAELEKSSGQNRERIQQEIEHLQNSAPTDS